ncbi:IS200/IS605 family transposase, partial [bacterium]|nr:IS200/IS605 family transposase [bacterium]
YGNLRKHLGEVLRELARQKECHVLEGNLLPNHVHMLVSIPPKYAVAQVIGYIKGKSAIHIARNYFKHKNASGHKFWARGYHVSTIGRDEEVIRRYIKEQEKEDQRIDQLTIFDTQF